MKAFLYYFKRFFVMWQCAWILSSRCFRVAFWAKLGKAHRTYVTEKLHDGGVKILKSVNARCEYTSNYFYEAIGNRTPKIFMSNHLSLFDLPLITAHIPENIRVVIKKELLKVPFIGSAALASEQVIVDRHEKNHEAFYKTAKEKLQSGIALWFFPEGTRSRSGELQPFKMGGFRLASIIDAQIIPVGIVGTNRVLPAGKLMPHLNQSIAIRIGNPISAHEFNNQDLSVLVDKVTREINHLIQTD